MHVLFHETFLFFYFTICICCHYSAAQYSTLGQFHTGVVWAHFCAGVVATDHGPAVGLITWTNRIIGPYDAAG